MYNEKNFTTLRRLLLFFMVSLVISGATAMPVDRELVLLLPAVPSDSTAGLWGHKVLDSYRAVKEQYPFLLYGNDWLAFAHFVLAILFIGPYNDPLKNSWVIKFGLIACVLVLPFALLVGAVRGIPFWWRLIDCSFGVVGFAVLWPCYRIIRREAATAATFSKTHARTLLHVKS